MRITKKLNKEFDLALCMGDVLFEKHKRMSADIQRQATHYIHNRKEINTVTLIGKNGTRRRLQVVNVYVSDQGTFIEVIL